MRKQIEERRSNRRGRCGMERDPGNVHHGTDVQSWAQNPDWQRKHVLKIRVSHWAGI